MAKQKSPKAAPKKEASKKASGSWARNYYIRNFGRVYVGDAVTQSALDAWDKHTKAKPQIEA